MKALRKGLALLLALLIVLSLSGCGSLQALKTMRKIQKLESYRADCSIDMSMSLGMFAKILDALDRKGALVQFVFILIPLAIITAQAAFGGDAIDASSIYRQF